MPCTPLPTTPAFLEGDLARARMLVPALLLAGPFPLCLPSLLTPVLCLQDVCPRDGGAGGGDRPLAHRHEGTQVSRPGTSRASLVGSWCLFLGSVVHSRVSPPGGRREREEGTRSEEDVTETWTATLWSFCCSAGVTISRVLVISPLPQGPKDPHHHSPLPARWEL